MKTLWPVDLAAVYSPSDRMDMTNPMHLACAAALVGFSRWSRVTADLGQARGGLGRYWRRSHRTPGS